MEKEIFYTSHKNNHKIVILNAGPTFIVKVFDEHNELIAAPVEFCQQFWIKPKQKKELANILVELKVWDKKEAAGEMDGLSMTLYNRWAELKKEKKEEKKIEIGPLAKERAIKLLRHPNLMDIIEKDMDRVIAGERHNKLLLFLIYLTAFIDQKIHPRFTGGSSAGKSYTLNQVANYLPQETILWRATRATGKALEYHLSGKDLNGKILIIQEFEGAQDAIITLRPLMSGDGEEGGLQLKSVKKDASGNIVASDISCTGTPLVATASTQLQLDAEFETRTWKLESDESIEQSDLISIFEAEMQINPKTHQSQIKEEIQDAVRILRDEGTSSVRILFAKEIAKSLPKDNLRIRRDLKKIFGFIKVSAWLHQFQRPYLWDGENWQIIATLEDFRIAQELYRPSAELTFMGRSKTMMKLLGKIADNYEKTNSKISMSQLHRMTKHPKQSLRTWTGGLIELGLLDYTQNPVDKREKIFWPILEKEAEKALPSSLIIVLDSFTVEEAEMALNKVCICGGLCIGGVHNDKRLIPLPKITTESIDKEFMSKNHLKPITSQLIREEIIKHRPLPEEPTHIHTLKETKTTPVSLTEDETITTVDSSVILERYEDFLSKKRSIEDNFSEEEIIIDILGKKSSGDESKVNQIKKLLKQSQYDGHIFCPFEDGKYSVVI